MKILRYLLNTILFFVIWCIPAFIFTGISLSVSGTRPSAIPAVGGIVAIIISYRLVKRINKSDLWSNLFNEKDIKQKLIMLFHNNLKTINKVFIKFCVSNINPRNYKGLTFIIAVWTGLHQRTLNSSVFHFFLNYLK